MGGGPGTRETDLLAPDKTVQKVDALVLSGGSAFGLDACGGVADELRKIGRGFAIGNVTVPIVPGAIVFDLLNGGNKSWDVNPYPALGREALNDAAQNFALGSVGAGTGAMAARHKGGLGSASVVLPDGTTVAALVVVNAMGSVTTNGDRHFWAAPFEMDSEFGGLGPDPTVRYTVPDPSRKESAMGSHASIGTNTTIAIIATDATLAKTQCHRLAVNAHDGMARAIVPSHTPLDSDLVFGVSTGTGAPVDHVAYAPIGAAAATCLSRAIARAIYEATPAQGDLITTYC